MRAGVSAAEVPLGVVSAAFSALSGLVALVEQLTEQSTERLWRLNNAEALVEQRERERDNAQRVLEIAAKKAHEEFDRRVAAEALLARHRQALEDPEAIARRFHEAYERLAPDYGYETRKESAVPWEDVPENNRALMIATVEAALAASAPGTEEP